MGSAVSSQVDSALSALLDVPTGECRLGFGSSYRARNARIKPLELGSGLRLTGSIELLEISVNSFSAIASTLVGSAPPTTVTLRGVAVDIGRGVEGSGRLPPPPSESLRRQLQNVTVDVQDLSVTLNLAGRALSLHIGAADLRPPRSGVDASVRKDGAQDQRRLSFRVNHRGVRLRLNGSELGLLEDGSLLFKVGISASSRRHDVLLDLMTAAVVRLDTAQLRGILDVAAEGIDLASQAIATCQGHNGVPRSIAGRLSVNLPKTSLRLDAFSEELLRVSSSSVTFESEGQMDDVIRGEGSFLCNSMAVRYGGAEQISDVLFIKPKAHRRLILQHDFPACGELPFPPWRGVVELLVVDPEFARHKVLLQQLCDGWDARRGAGASRRRARDDDDAEAVSEQAARRPRL